MSKKPRDLNQVAASVVGIATGQIDPTTKFTQAKDPAAVALGRKGGKSRAKKLSADERTEIAKAAALKRWGKDSY